MTLLAPTIFYDSASTNNFLKLAKTAFADRIVFLYNLSLSPLQAGAPQLVRWREQTFNPQGKPNVMYDTEEEKKHFIIQIKTTLKFAILKTNDF